MPLGCVLRSGPVLAGNSFSDSAIRPEPAEGIPMLRLKVVGHWRMALISPQPQESRNADVFTNHTRRAIAHGDAATSRMETIERAGPQVVAIDEAERVYPRAR